MAEGELDGGVLLLNFRGLTVLPAYLTKSLNYGNIKRLYLKQNKLIGLPDNISNLCNLVELYVSNNKLTSLPEAMGDLKCLVSLNLEYNDLCNLPESIDGLISLRTLSLARNDFRSVPPKIWTLPNLRVLDLTGNDLRSLKVSWPKTSQRPRLERLVLDKNHLESLPRQICTLESLKEISVVGNRLRSLPLDLGYLKNLGAVLVDGNRDLNAVPVSLTTQSLGINGCGASHSQPTDHSSVIKIPSSTDSERSDELVHLPREILRIGDSATSPVVSLLEYCLRAVFQNFRASLFNCLPLPRNLIDTLVVPTASCIICSTPVFTYGFPAIFGGQLHEKYGVYRLGLCCSLNCSRLCPIRIQMPLIFPTDV